MNLFLIEAESLNHLFVTLQVFSLTVIFGLYHGLVLLPVLLFILGPDKEEEEADKAQSVGQEGTNNNYGTRGHDNLVFVQEVNLWNKKSYF